MRLFQRRILKVVVIVVGSVLGLAWPAGAQPKPETEGANAGAVSGQRFRPGNRPPGGDLGFAPGLERIFRVLTEEQRASLKEAMDAERERLRELAEKTREARKALFESGLEKFDETSVREKAMTAARLEAEMTVIRVKAFSKMRPPLSAEQLQKLSNLPAPEGGEPQPGARRRPDVPRDEHGLPLKDRPSPADAAPPPAPK
jgi:Spy/CpxP family protein refolding chaperone